MPDWEFRAAYEKDVPWFTPKKMDNSGYSTIPLIGDRIPSSLWDGNVRVIVFSSTQLRQTPVSLLEAASRRGIPTLAIEESNQVALNGGRINNYLLPVDHLLVASESELQGMIAAGVPEKRIKVTGWPFFIGQVGKFDPKLTRTKKVHFKLDPDRPVASLTLTALGDAGESPKVRSRQLTLAAQGLPDNYQLVVKPHPIEPFERLEPFIREYAPHAHVIPGKVPILELLQATNVLLNRGASQVCFEALLQNIPVLILDTGITTPFHNLVPNELIIYEPSDIVKALGKFSGKQNVSQVYKSFMASHLPYPPEQAQFLTCKAIEKIASQSKRASVSEAKWFYLALLQAWVGNSNKAFSNLTQCQSKEYKPATKALRALIHYQASQSDLETLKRFLGSRFSNSLLQSLWILQLGDRKAKPTEKELEWLQNFPPFINTSWFIPLTKLWATILIRSGEKEGLELFVKRLENQFMQERDIGKLQKHLKYYQQSEVGQLRYYIYRFVLRVREWSHPLKSAIIKLINKFRRRI